MVDNTVYSIVVPVYNEQECLKAFYDKIIPVLEKTGESFEIIFVNDGSVDKSREIAENLAQSDGRIKLINFSRNFGQQAAILCGFKNSCGAAIIELDADLQDPPQTVLKMISKWKEGFYVVHGKRVKRKGEGLFKRITANLYYRFLKKITGFEMPRNSGDFKLIDRRVMDVILTFKEHNPYLRGMTPYAGFKQTCVEFEREERVGGETKYSMKKMLKLASDGILANSNYPLKFPLKIGIATALLSVIAFIVLPLLLIWGINVGISAYFFPSAGLMTGIILICQGLSGIYTARIYDEVKNRPIYIVESKINFKNQGNNNEEI